MMRSNAAAWPVRANIQGQTIFQRLCMGLLLGLALLAAKPALADPPTRAGRVAEVVGDAWLFDAESKEWVRLLRNQTVAEGDRLRTDERSRVSLRVGSTSLWVDERSDLEFTQLDEGRVLLQLARGDLGLRLRSQEAVSEYKVQTREGMSLAEREGLYRVEQLDRGSKVYALQGRLRFESGRGGDVPPVWLESGEQAELWWANGPRTERQRLEGDSFSDWVLAQSRAEGDSVPAVAQRYVSPEMTGVEDLDRNGRWEQSPEFGAVWIPTVVVADWAPYRYGRWVWTRHWGWSWVDDAPWGFAPFHYGRWVHWGNRWCWSPGRYVVRPVYAPALVAWVGGGGVGVGVTIGGHRPPPPRYGWYPLAPREVYVPGYRHSPGYEHRLNHERDPVTVQRPHRNREVVGAVSYLPGQGGPARPMPAADLGPVRALPAAPARNELQSYLPQRPSREANAPQTGNRPAADGNGPGMPWRSENASRRERERERDFAGPEPVRNAVLPSQTGPAVNANPNAGMNPGRPADLPWRGNREQEQRQNLPQNQAGQPMPQPQQQQVPAVNNGLPQRPTDSRDRAWDRNAERNQERNAERRQESQMDRSGPTRNPAFERPQERQLERQMERPVERQIEQRPPERQFERQIERQPERARAADLPQRAPEARPPSPPPAPPAAQPQQQQGPSRGETNGPPRRGGTEQDKR